MKPEEAPEIRCGSTHQAEEDEPDDEDEVEASVDGIVDGRIQLRVAAVASKLEEPVVTAAVLGASTFPLHTFAKTKA